MLSELHDKDHTYLENVTIDEKIGSGNFGVVYHGELAGHDIALKKITGSNEYENLKKEANVLKEFRHPNIVKYFGLYKAERSGDEYIVCEFANGGSLKSALENVKETQVPNKQLLRFCLETAHGMTYIHSKKFMHRDLACRNLLLMVEGKIETVKVADFGMASQLPSSPDLLPVRWTPP